MFEEEKTQRRRDAKTQKGSDFFLPFCASASLRLCVEIPGED
jgi:hypothetical protein